MRAEHRSVGLVHDYLLVLRGAERTFAAIADLWPEAPVYTLLYDRAGTRGRFDSHPVRPSYLQRLGVGQRGFRRLLPLFPRAAERLPVGRHDCIISSSSAFGHGIRPPEGAIHVCYCHSPFRYAWHESQAAEREVPRAIRPLVRRSLLRNRRWDRMAAERVTHYIANSGITHERIARWYDREATIIHPPVDVARFSIGEPEDWFLMVSEVVRHKRIDTALEAAKRAGRTVKVVGTGPELERLQALYGSTAEFLGRVDDAELTSLYSRARALILPNVEEFGIAAVEAQAAGRPVVAAAGGGALETVLDGETGVLVPRRDIDALAEALADTDFGAFSPQRSRDHAERFSVESFMRRFSAEVERVGGPAPDVHLRAAAR